MIKNKTFLSATIASITVLASVAAALATPVAATRGVNVRSGPGTNFSILDTLRGGEFAEAVECVQSGWCRVEHDGPSGWVYNTYLGPRPGAQNNSGGNQGGNPANPAQPAPQQNAQMSACFYTEQVHQGEEYCSGLATYNTLGGFNNRIRSYKVFGGAHVNFCVEENMAGSCFEGSRTTPTLGGPLDRQASSLSVFTVGGNNSGGGFNLPAEQPPAAPNPQPPANNPPANNSNDSDCSFAILLGPDGPTASLTCGDNAVLPPAANGNNNQGNGQENNGAIIAAPAPGPAIDFGAINIIADAINNQAQGNAPQANPPQGNQGQLIEPPLPPAQMIMAPPAGDVACVYPDADYQGQRLCYGDGTIIHLLGGDFSRTIESVLLGGDAHIKLCRDASLKGGCTIQNDSNARLPAGFINNIQSFRVFTGNQIPSHSATGNHAISSGKAINLDANNPRVNANSPAADFSYEVISGLESRISPLNGAAISFVTSAPWHGYEGCLMETKTPDSITFTPRVGAYFCVETDMGRLSEFYITAFNGNTISVSYETWSKRH